MDDAAVSEIDMRTQLRLGIVMTGGVSLAVWMGGVTLELDRLRREVPGTAYEELCGLLGVRPVVDIISGTSAGGLNGTLLASAAAWESHLEDLRGVWLGTADMVELLRKPGESSPPSLLDGDGYFLDQTRQAIAEIKAHGQASNHTGPALERSGLPPVHLTVTSTLMQGNDVYFQDALGSTVTSTTHLATYSFSTDASEPGGGRAGFDHDDVVGQLARAARSSASFPGAFEASRIDTDSTSGVDMAPAADFVQPGEGPATRYVLDGGLVANEPIDQVYDLIRDQPSDVPVRRVLFYVSPLSGAEGVAASTSLGAPAPDLLDVLAGTLLIPRQQNIVRQLRAILARSDERRGLNDVRRNLTITADTAPQLLHAAEELAPFVDRQRAHLTLAAAGASVVNDDSLAATADREARRQALLLVQDLLLRAAVRAHGLDDRRALSEQRGAVSKALTSQDGSDEATRSLLEAAYQLLTEKVASIARTALVSAAPNRPTELLVSDLARVGFLVAAAEADGSSPREAVWRAVRALDILLTVSSTSLTPNPQRIDLVQLSANTPNAIDGRNTAEAKLTGIQFHHFGAFYRAGWRANDWMWGRLDGAMRISELLIDPDALLATGVPIDELATALHSIAVGPETGDDHTWLVQQLEQSGGVEGIKRRLAAAGNPDSHDRQRAVMDARRHIACMVARRIQLQILRDELPYVRTYVAVDHAVGAAATPRDTAFLEMAKQLDGAASAATVAAVFRACHVGKDRLEEELGSDRMTALATQTLAVSTGAIDHVADVKGLDFARPAFKTMWWALRLANGLTSTGFRGSQLAKVAIPTVAVLAAALMATALSGGQSRVVQLVFGIVLAGVVIAAVLTNLDKRRFWIGAAVSTLAMVGGLLLTTLEWSAAPFVGTSVAVLAAAVLAALILRRHGGVRTVPPVPTLDLTRLASAGDGSSSRGPTGGTQSPTGGEAPARA